MLKEFKRFLEKIDTREMQEYLETFRDALDTLNEDNYENQDTQSLVLSLIHEQDQEGYWGIIESPHVDGDTRVEFWYKPTYIATAFLLKYWLISLNRNKSVDGMENALIKGLKASTGRGFNGHGHDDMEGRIEAVDIFKAGGVIDLLDKHPNLCPEFSTIFEGVLEGFRNAIETDKTKGDWGEEYRDRIFEALKGFSGEEGILIFVYGTLMEGQRNHKEYLSYAKFITKGVVVGYTLHDLGNFPGIKKSSKGVVEGEVYKVDQDTLHQLDLLEGEGTLFVRDTAEVICYGMKLNNVYLYLYNQTVSKKSTIKRQPMDEKSQDKAHVWYAVYGSNLLFVRFATYILGGDCIFNGKHYPGCTNKNLPTEYRPYEIPYPVYYGNRTSSWGEGGVSFLDTERSGKTLGRIYRITKEQFEEIKKQEGSSSNWYDETITLGKLDGIPVVTLTNKNGRPTYLPSDAYIEVVRRGLKETYPQMSEYDRMLYLTSL
ncbi:MAG: gamma-glutamylcyclotransferase [Dethiosulfatibacter sp.]|nr:gamma-glutamylcyclotransferase [Dethiosulfatibacter sp.]